VPVVQRAVEVRRPLPGPPADSRRAPEWVRRGSARTAAHAPGVVVRNAALPLPRACL